MNTEITNKKAENQAAVSKSAFYTRPFYEDHRWVYDAKNNFTFQFYKTVTKEEMKAIIFRLNALDKNTEEIQIYNLEYHPDTTSITNNGFPFIEIRGWGNLTGIGGYNFTTEKAAKIQDDFALYLIDNLSIPTT